jgi:hypothetical protein
MAKRALIMYFTMTGNTTKVANRFQEVFKRRGWECDILKLDRKTNVSQPSPYDCSKYDFFCFGSGSYTSMPAEQLIFMMRNNPQDIHYNPRGPSAPLSPTAPGPEKQPSFSPPEMPSGQPPVSGHKKLVMTPDWQKGIAFLTFAGHEFGWIEAVPGLEAIALEMMHMKIQCVGKFCCPGRFGAPSDQVYFKDHHIRPNEKDLQSAEIFLERTLDENE